VFLAYASDNGHVLIDRELYLPKMRVKLKAAAVTASDKKGQPAPDLWSISVRMKSAISSAACNSSPA
jgi:hypothetical protein